jgi:hypothetical protein
MKRNFIHLTDVELIGMAVEHEGGVAHHTTGKISTRKPWQQTMIPPPTYRPISSEGPNRGQRSLENTGALAKLYPDRKNRPAGDSIPGELGRDNAGIILESCFCKSIKSPERTPDNGKIRRTIAFHRLSGDLFKEILSISYVGEKLIRGLLSDFQVPMAMARYFMSIILDLLDELGKGFGELAEHEHGRSHPGLA